MKSKFLKAGAILTTLLCLTSTKFVFAADYDITPPSVIAAGISYGMHIEQGGNVSITLTFSDDTALGSVYMKESDIVLNGFNATKTLIVSGSKRIIKLTNISGEAGNKTITIQAGVAKDAAGNYSDAIVTSSFYLNKKTVPVETPVAPVVPTVKRDSTLPVVKIGSAKPSSIYNEATVSYKVTFSDNVGVNSVSLKASNIKLHGFSANISISGTGTKTRTITLKNIKGTVGTQKYITINSSVAVDKTGNRSKAVNSPKFSILKKNIGSTSTNTTQVTKPSELAIISTKCIDDLKLLGSVNSELTTFTSWLRSEKTDVSYAQENNRVAENEKMTYYVEYYNANSTDIKNAILQLTIPYKALIEEVSEGGTVNIVNNTTIVEWKLSNIKPSAACRLFVKVKFLENSALKASKNISEQFFVTMKSNADGNESFSYLRQLFVDITEGKVGQYTSYLTALDTTNRIRPNDEVTRAEFAKMLADSGVVKIDVTSKEYEKFNDYEKIPVYARGAVSALKATNILHTFSDGEFKPNNPILIEDAIEMIAKASNYVSENKLIVDKPVFLYTDSLVDSEKEISPKKDYVMELIRQNVITKYEFKSDKYMLRREAVEIINSLMFRGPYVDKAVESVIKYNDLKKNTSYYYNIIGATNTYNFLYNYKLWEEMIEINN